MLIGVMLPILLSEDPTFFYIIERSDFQVNIFIEIHSNYYELKENSTHAFTFHETHLDAVRGLI